MPYGTIKVDTITFTSGSSDVSVAISGLVQNPTFSGDVTVTGTVSGTVVRGNTVSGATVTGTAGQFGTLTGNTAGFTTITGTTVTGTTGSFTSGVFASGTAAAPSVSVGTTTNGIYSPASNEVAISTNSAGRLQIDSTGQVRAGAEFDSDRTSHKVQLSAADENVLSLQQPVNTVGAKSSLGFWNRNSNNAAVVYGKINTEIKQNNAGNHIGDLVFSTVTGGSLGEKVRITGGGLVGIGTSSPTGLLTVAASAPAIDWTNSSNTAFKHTIEANNYSSTAANNTFAFKVASGSGTQATIMTLNGAGNVGIGTTSPQVDLQIGNADGSSRDIVVHTVNNGNARLRFREGGTIASGYNEYSFGMVGTANAMSWESQGLGELGRWDSGGRLLVGTSTAESTTIGGLLQIQATGSSASLLIKRNSANAIAPYIYLAKSRGANNATTIVASGDSLGELRFAGADGSTEIGSLAALIKAEVDGTPGANDMPGRLVFSTTADGASSPTERMRITSTGDIGTSAGLTLGNTTPTAGGFYATTAILGTGAGTNAVKFSTTTGKITYDTSSRLNKEQIGDCPYGIAEIKQLQPRRYYRIDDQRLEVGFVADEVVNILPEFVPFGPKSAITGNEQDTEEIPLGVNYEKLTAVLTAALQEAIGRIEILEAEVAALKAA